MVDAFQQSPLTVLVHANFETLSKSTRLALVAAGDVDRTLSALLAVVVEIAANRALEEAPAAITAGHTVVATGRLITAHFAENVRVLDARRRSTRRRGGHRMTSCEH